MDRFATLNAMAPQANTFLRQSTETRFSRNFSAQNTLRAPPKNSEVKGKWNKPASGKNLVRINSSEKGSLRDIKQPGDSVDSKRKYLRASTAHFANF
jgi:hypothetical protein